MSQNNNPPIPGREFTRDFYREKSGFASIGNGEPGGKARGLMEIRDVLSRMRAGDTENKFTFTVPDFIVITTQYFDEFMTENRLMETALSSHRDERIIHHFLQAQLPVKLAGYLRIIVENTRCPLAVRSSSLIEDSLNLPLAGVYGTKMIPNNDPDPDIRYKKLSEAVKFVYASTYSLNAKSYLKAAGKDCRNEKMGVIIQNVVGTDHHRRFYPHISGVAKSYNFYSTGHAVPEDGTVSLALGLGKTIVDGGRSWNYCPVYPDAPPPFNSAADLLKQTQTEFWAVNLEKVEQYDPIKETEFLIKRSLEDAEYDNTLSKLASTYNYEADRFDMGTFNKGARLLNFAPLLQTDRIPLNRAVRVVLKKCEEKFGTDVEIEFAVNLESRNHPENSFNLLQVRPMAARTAGDRRSPDEYEPGKVLAASRKALGDGTKDFITDIVYVKPETFQLKETRSIADEIAELNRKLLDNRKPYLLIGFGRWGSSDSWLGIPVNWPQISGAEVIIESSLEGVHIDMSQGSHFFHNISNLGVFYFSVLGEGSVPVDWKWLDTRKHEEEKTFVRHVSLKDPLTVKVDGRTGTGVILK